MFEALVLAWRLSVAADFAQTSFLNRSGDRLIEYNPQYRGKTDLVNGLQFLATSEGVVFVVSRLPKRWQAPALGIALAHRLSFVFQNHRVGVPGRFYVPLVSIKFRS